LPEGKKYYHATDQGYERKIKERLDHWKSLHLGDAGKAPPA
jgi:hypothetical protein